MRVAVTGGTGFIGSHTVAALAAGGHDVRMLVRTPEKVAKALGPLGVDEEAVDTVEGNLADIESIDRLLDGADACLHAAAVVATRRKDMGAVKATNVSGAKTVLDSAIKHGCDPIVHVSSISAVFPSPTGVLSSDLPVATSKSVYGQTKAECERYARDLQSEGHPVVIVYPGGVTGPDDAGLNAMANGTVGVLKGGFFPNVKAGGNVVVDVRDLAMAHERMMRPGLGPRRFMAGGRFITWQENVDLLQDLTGRNFKAPKISTRMVLAIGRVGDLMARFTPIQPPIDYEGAYYMSHLTPSDDSAIHDDLGVKWRPTEESMRDMLVWMVAAGHIDPKKAGTIGAT